MQPDPTNSLGADFLAYPSGVIVRPPRPTAPPPPSDLADTLALLGSGLGRMGAAMAGLKGGRP